MKTASGGSTWPAVSSVFGFWPVTITRLPSAAKSLAVARPIPVVPPVMRIVRGLISSRMIVLVTRKKITRALAKQCGWTPSGFQALRALVTRPQCRE